MADAVTSNGADDGGNRRTVGGGGRAGKVPRLPRWTRQEILVLIQGKKVAERRGGGGRGRSRINHMGVGSGAAGSLVGTGAAVEPKWATVASYCRRHGVHRAPVQCRKRWSNLAGDFKKIREWEAVVRVRSGGAGGESYWTMRNDVRRERKLPGFFDREVFDILDGAVELGGTAGDGDDLEDERRDDGGKQEEQEEEEEEVAAARSPRTQPLMSSPAPPPPPAVAEAAMVEDDEGEPVLDSAGAAEDEDLFSDSDPNGGAEGDREDNHGGRSSSPDDHPPGAAVAATPLSGTKPGSFYPTRPPDPGFANGRHPIPEAVTLNEDISQGTAQRRHGSTAESSSDTSIHNQLIRIFEQNNRMLATQLEAHNVNCQQEREERKEMINSVIRVIGKLASAVEKMADKL